MGFDQSKLHTTTNASELCDAHRFGYCCRSTCRCGANNFTVHRCYRRLLFLHFGASHSGTLNCKIEHESRILEFFSCLLDRSSSNGSRTGTRDSISSWYWRTSVFAFSVCWRWYSAQKIRLNKSSNCTRPHRSQKSSPPIPPASSTTKRSAKWVATPRNMIHILLKLLLLNISTIKSPLFPFENWLSHSYTLHSQTLSHFAKLFIHPVIHS